MPKRVSTSSQPRKVRKRYLNAPLHIKRNILAAHLSKELREKYGIRSLPVRVGDEVLIMRGTYKGRTAKVIRISTKKLKVYLEGITRQRSDGRVVHIPFHPSNLMIIKLDLSDPRRRRKLERIQEMKGLKPVEEAPASLSTSPTPGEPQ